MKKEKGSLEEITALMKLAKNDLAHAHLDMKEDFYRQAVVSAYYVVLSSSRALLLNKGFIPKSHSGVFIMLNLHFIKKGVIPKNYGAKISELFENRLNANYNAQREFTKEEAEEALKVAEEFYQRVYKLIYQT